LIVMSVQAGGETRSGIGMRLRAGRERRGLTVLQAAEKMHVDPKILESLESENFDALGAPVYVRGHLRHYAELVGEPASELQAIYANSTRVAPPDLTRIPKGEPSADPRRLAVPATVVLLVFAIAGGVWWVVTLPKRQPHATPSATVARQSGAPSTTPSEPPVERQVTAEPPRTAPRGAVALQVPAAAAIAAAAKSSREPATAATAARDAQLTLRFAAESWAEVYDSRGERLFYDVGPADSVRTFKGKPPMRVVLGNAPGVAVEVNGRAADLAGLTHADGTAQFVVSRAGRVSRPLP
jgi:cytoskeleton protein RodZ